MPDLSLRERIENIEWDDYETPLALIAAVLSIIDEYERDLVARIEALKYTTAKDPCAVCHDRALEGVLALIKPVVKDSVTTQQRDPRAGHLKPTRSETEILDFVHDGIRAEGHDPDAPITPRDERPARDKVASWSADKRNGDEPSYVLAIVEAIDTAANRIARALEGR